MKVGRLVKEQMLEELTRELGERPNLFVTQVNRLNSSGANSLRQQLHASGARLWVVKRRLGVRALEQLKIEGAGQLLDGSTALVFPRAENEVIAKLIAEFIKANEGQLSIRGAVLDGQLLDQRRVEELADLPPKPTLLAQVVLTIESPMADAIFTLERLIGDVAWVLEELAKQRPQAAEPPVAQKDVPADAAEAAQPEASTKAPDSGGATPEHGEKSEAPTPQPPSEETPKPPPATEEGTSA